MEFHHFRGSTSRLHQIQSRRCFAYKVYQLQYTAKPIHVHTWQTYKSSRDKSNAQKDAVQFIKQKLDSAKWFIEAIKQRQETLQ